MFYGNKQIHNRQAVSDIFHSKHEPHREVQMGNKTAVKVYRLAAVYSYVKRAKTLKKLFA